MQQQPASGGGGGGAPTAPLPVLITMGVSHFVEKARWGLQRLGIPYTEEVHAPGFHGFAVRAAGGRRSVPCLRLPPPPADGTASGSTQPGPGCVDESTPILRWADEQAAAAAAVEGRAPPPPLFPPGEQGAEVDRLCTEFDRRLGPAVRRWAYSHLLYTPAITAAMTASPAPGVDVPTLEWLALRCGGWLLLRNLMKKGLGITPEGGAAALQTIRHLFDDVGDLLADGRRYLTGSQFTAADLAFAALAAPAVGQPYGTAPGLGPAMPPDMRAQVEELRAHPAGRYALRLWESERGVVLRGPGATQAGAAARY